MSKQVNITRKLNLNSPERKPSVFERLGTKSGAISIKNVCRNWAQSGACPLNKQCKLAHTHVLVSPSKRSKSETMKKSVVAQHKKMKDDHKKLRSHKGSDLEWEGWELGDLEDADEKVLEKRKQELQRELQLQLKREKELNKKKDKKSEKKRTASSSSSSSTTTESSTSSTSSSSSSSEPRAKRANRKRKHSSSSSESERSFHRQKKTPKTVKAKTTGSKKQAEKKDVHTHSDSKSKSVVVAKKVTQKKSFSPNWEKPRGRSPLKQQALKKSPNFSPDGFKNKSSSPQYDKVVVKNKSKCFSPKAKDSSPKRTVKKSKESVLHMKEKSRQSPGKMQGSPSRGRKISPPRSSRRPEDSSEKRRNHYEDQKHSPRKGRSREKDRKRELRRARSHDNESNGGLKKGGKILPLKPANYSKEGGTKKDGTHHKVPEKNVSESKAKEGTAEKDRKRIDREKERVEKEKSKCDRDRLKHKKGSDEHNERRPTRDRDSERASLKGRNERGRDRESERLKFTKERESERQKERDEALERCRERQKERERLEKERKEKGDKKHQRETFDNRELPSLLDLKPENLRNADVGNINSEKHLARDGRRNSEKGVSDKGTNQDRDGRDRCTSLDRDHDRRDSRRSVDADRRQADRDHEARRNREETRNSSEVRRSLGDGRRLPEGGNEGRRQWEDGRRAGDSVHERRRTLDSAAVDRRHSLGRRPIVDDPYRRSRGGEPEPDVRDFPTDERRGGAGGGVGVGVGGGGGGRKPLYNSSERNIKDETLDYRNPDGRDEWSHSDRHRDWNTRFEHKWVDRDESRDAGWNHYPRRVHDEWNGDWKADQTRQAYPEENRLDLGNEAFSADLKEKRQGEFEGTSVGDKEKEMASNQEVPSEVAGQQDKSLKGDGDVLSDISDDPDDILNQDDEPVEENLSNSGTQNSCQPIYIKSDELLFDQRRPLLECLGERSLDFEEISDEELEEEARANKGIVDVLGADWAGLLKETRPKPQRAENSGSAHRRWTTKRLILNLGISVRHAGEKFANEMMAASQADVEVKEADAENVSSNSNETSVRNGGERSIEKDTACDLNDERMKSPVSQSTTSKWNESGETLLHPVPALHGSIRETTSQKCQLFLSHNRFKRALSARTDLSLRRELCNLPSKEHLHFIPPLDKRMYEVSVQQFQSLTTAAAV